MMLRRLPPLNALKAFEAAARHESFTRAAEELCVTQGAVSHQVKALEAELGIKLFNRERQRLIITEAGREYLTVLRDSFDRIAVGTERLDPAPEFWRPHRQHVARLRRLGYPEQ
jgi:LysR family transcriptional regulator, glycine cleavage system transcriptional activator